MTIALVLTWIIIAHVAYGFVALNNFLIDEDNTVDGYVLCLYWPALVALVVAIFMFNLTCSFVRGLSRLWQCAGDAYYFMWDALFAMNASETVSSVEDDAKPE